MDVRNKAKKTEIQSTDGNFRIHYQRGHGRTNSQVTLTNISTNESAALDTVTKLGEGNYGIVWERRNKNLAVAVKHPHKRKKFFATTEKRSDGLRCLQREQEFLNRCYPKESPYALFTWMEIDNNTHPHHPYKLDSRIVMPLIKGVKFKTWLRATTDYDLLAIVIFNIAKELQRFHELGILHGDVSSRNIMVLPNCSVHFIDFSFAYNITDDATIFVGVKDPTKYYIAPERLNVVPPKTIKANFAQDVFSLAFNIEKLINLYVNLPNMLAFYQKFPAIERFIASGLNTAPDERPTLQSLLKDLSPSLILPSIKMASMSHDGDYLTALLRMKADSCTITEINQLLYALCLQKKHVKIEAIIEFLRKEVPAYKNNRILDIFTVIVELRKQVDNLHKGMFHDNQRKSLIDQLAAGLKFAESLVNHPSTPLAPELLRAVNHAPALFDIHHSMLGEQLVDMSISSSSDEMNIATIRK